MKKMQEKQQNLQLISMLHTEFTSLKLSDTSSLSLNPPHGTWSCDMTTGNFWLDVLVGVCIGISFTSLILAAMR